MSDGGRSPIPDEIVPRSLTLQGIVESLADLQSLFAEAEPARRHRIVQSEGSPEIERMLYERAKRDLAAREWKYMQHYADAKDEIVEAILQRARGAREGSG